MLLSNYKKQTCSHLTIVISITEDLHVAILKGEHALTDDYRALQFLAAMLAFLLLILFFIYKLFYT